MGISYQKIINYKKDDVENQIRDYKEVLVPDIHQAIEDNCYLVRQRIENLEMQIGKSEEEILELETLKEENKEALEELKLIPEDLGVPSKIDTFVAALEAVRGNRYGGEYDGGEEDAEYVSNVNRTYTNLLKEGWLNTRSFRFLNKDGVIFCGDKEISLFDVFDTSDFGKVFHRCNDLATSPIYEEMRKIKEDHYMLDYGIQVKFKDKSARFLVPFDQFRDIPKIAMNIPEFIEFDMVLPEYAHDKKRYFQKGADVGDFVKYLKRLCVPISDTQKEYLKNLGDKGILRLYREVLENENEYMIRSYFLNFTGISISQKNNLEERLFQFFNGSDLVDMKRVLPTKNFPDWMRKIGGIVVEQVNGEFEHFKKPRRITVDPDMNGKKEFLFIPSRKLRESDLPMSEWQEAFLAELRERYKKNAQIFQQYAKNVMRGKTELVCGCENGNHQERCVVSILKGVFDRIIYS